MLNQKVSANSFVVRRNWRIQRTAVQFLVFVLLCIFFNPVLGVEQDLNSNVKGVWIEPGEVDDQLFNWEAQWIWMPEENADEVMLARRTFDLNKVPSKAILRISASEKYELYVNGTYVCRGPARCAAHHQSYDILDVSLLLKSGKNTIAVRANYQSGKISYQHWGRAGLLAQLTVAMGKQIITLITDNKWKVIADPSWGKNPPRQNRFQLVVNDRVDMGEFLNGWNSVNYDDKKWQSATPLMRKYGWPMPSKNAKAQPLTPPWTNLIPRDIPYLVEGDVKAENLIEAFNKKGGDGINSVVPFDMFGHIDHSIAKQLKKYQKKEEAITIPESSNEWVLLFDFGELINGMPTLDIRGPKGAVVDVLCAPYVVDNKFTHKIVDSEYRDRIVLSGSDDKWRATCFKPTRYMAVVVHGNQKPVTLKSVGIHQLSYPFKEVGQMKSSDAPWVEQYFKATAKTIKVCTTDAITDNYRERRQYAQTGYYGAMGNYYTFGDVALQRRYLIQVSQEQKANGLMPAYAPLAMDDYMVIMDSNCLWIRSLYNYLLYSGDIETVKELIPAAQKLMALLHSYTNDVGMIEYPPFAYWLDHALNDRNGANFNLNGHYLGALEDFAQLLEWTNISGGEVFQLRADLLRNSLRKYLWDPHKKLFADALVNGKTSSMFSEHANAMALATKVATSQQAKAIAEQLLLEDNHNYIRRESGVTMVTPAMSYFLHKGLCEYGYSKGSFKMFNQRFKKMLSQQTNQTLWEEWWRDAVGRTGKLQKGRTRSDAQTESAFPPALFAQYILGVKPTKPGMQEVTISKTSSGINNVEAKIPSPQGILEVKWSLKKNGNGELVLQVPGKMEVKLDLSSFGAREGKPIIVDGKRKEGDVHEKTIRLSYGNHRVEF